MSPLRDHPHIKHVSAEMSLRYGRLFDATVRDEYERALDLAKAQLGPVLPGERTRLPLVKTCPHANACGTQSWSFALAA